MREARNRFTSLLSRGWWRDVAALGAGAALPLAFAPFHVAAVCVASMAVLYGVWLRASPARALWRGFLFGIGLFGVGVTWIYVSIHDFGHVAQGVSIFITVLFVVVLSLFPALAGLTARRLVSGRGSGAGDAAALLLIFPAVWVLFEWIRGWFLTGFPWLALGYSQIDTPLAGLAPVLGVYGVSLAAAWSAGAAVYVIGTGGWRRRALGLTALAGLWLVGGALGAVAWTHPTGKTLRVSLVQGDLPQDIKWLESMRGPTIDLYERLTRKHWDSDLIVWPETAIPAFLREVQSDVDTLAAKARAHHTDLLVGLVTLNRASGRYYNTLMQIGDRTAFYYKHHLVPFTEYLPMRETLGGLIKFLDVPMSNFAAGPPVQPPMEVDGEKIGVSICYEDAFGEEVIRTMPDATLLVNVSNDAWFGRSIAPPQHLQIARMRAVETGRPMLRDTNTGISAIISADGRVRAKAPQFTVDVLTADVQPMAGMTPYSRMGNAAVLVLLVAMLASTRLARRRARDSVPGLP